MTIANKTVEELDAAYVACKKLADALRDYHQGTNEPSIQLGRFTVDEIDALVDDVLTEVGVIDEA